MRRSRPEKPRSASFLSGPVITENHGQFPGTLFIVSRRLPFSLPSSTGTTTTSPTMTPTPTPKYARESPMPFEFTGGLNCYKARAVQNRFESVVWVGLVAEEQAALFSREIEEHNRDHPQQQCLPVPVGKETFDKFYSFCKDVLWKMFHYSTPAQFQERQWQAYCEVNRLLAAAILERAHTRDTVWAHDYHLMMLPEMLRTGGQSPLRSFASSSSSSIPSLPPSVPLSEADNNNNNDDNNDDDDGNNNLFGQLKAKSESEDAKEEVQKVNSNNDDDDINDDDEVLHDTDDDDGVDAESKRNGYAVSSKPCRSVKYDGLRLQIGLFLHSPFPTSEIFRCLPVRRRLLFGMLHSDLVGFQTFDYARHFMRSCFRILGADQDIEGSPACITWADRRTSIGVFPIGIDPERFLPSHIEPGSPEEAREQKIAEIVASYEERYRGLRIILGKDTLEETKGVPHKLRAFERLLSEHPEYVGHLVYLQLTYPPSLDGLDTSESNKGSVSLSPTQEGLLAEINDLTTKINSRFGSLFYQPAQHIFRQPSIVELTALYRVADVAFLLPLRDGMNLTAHEFSVASFHKRSPIVLSEFAGSARILPGAFLCNPFNTMQVSNTLQAALQIGNEEKDAAHVRLTSFITSHTANNWGQRFLQGLFVASHESNLQTDCKPLDSDRLISLYRSTSRRRVFFLDYDGTLAPIVSRPELAVPSPRTLEILTHLCQDPLNLVIVISGRDCTTLENWLGGVPNLLLSAEHGAFIRRGAEHGWKAGNVQDVDLSWQPAVESVLEHYVGRTPGSWIERKRNNLVWHYRASDPSFAAYQAKELVVQLRETMVAKLPVEVMSGKKAVEIRPAGIHKGTIVKNILAEEDWGFAVAIGDDKTDEDMFNTLPMTHECFSVFVGTAHTTSAQYFLSSPDEVLNLLSGLCVPLSQPL